MISDVTITSVRSTNTRGVVNQDLRVPTTRVILLFVIAALGGLAAKAKGHHQSRFKFGVFHLLGGLKIECCVGSVEIEVD